MEDAILARAWEIQQRRAEESGVDVSAETDEHIKATPQRLADLIRGDAQFRDVLFRMIAADAIVQALRSDPRLMGEVLQLVTQ